MTAMFQGKPLFGPQGEPGATFTPSVSTEGVISWTNDKGLPNPEPVNIKGAKGENASNVYSTSETVIGTWFNGKPIYRRVVLFDNITIPGNSGNNIFGGIQLNGPSELALISFDEMITVSLSGYGMEPDSAIGGILLSVGYFYTANVFQFAQLISSSDKVVRSPKVILEYTKTTDVAPVSKTNLLTSEVRSPETLSSVSYAPASASSAKLDSGGDTV